jgi:hypothetical protein
MTPRRQIQVALALWMAFAFVAWNALFDYLVVRAGRDYLHEAAMADRQGRPHLLIAEWMRPAVRRAFVHASLLGTAILCCGAVGLFLAIRRQSRRSRS